MTNFWVFLSSTPLFYLTLTLAAYQLGFALYKRMHFNPLFNPVFLSVTVIVIFLVLTHKDYQSYFQGAQFVHFLLGPATVALAVPLYRQFEKVRRSSLAIFISILCGSVTASMSAVALVWLLGGQHMSMISIAPKSVTASVAMGISEQLGGLPSLTAVLVILTGICGAMVGPPLMNRMGITNWAARGFAMGMASHGIGTARAFQVNELAGAFAGLAMGLNALATALLLPLVWRLVFG